MVVLNCLPGVEATILVNGEPLHEYEHAELRDPDDATTVSRYVEAQLGQTFSVKVICQDGSTRGAGFGYRILVDGSQAEATILPSEYCKDQPDTWISQGWAMREDGKLKYAPYTFGESIASG